MPYINPFRAEMRKIGSDNRTVDRELLDDEALKKEIDRVKPLVDLQTCDKETARCEFSARTKSSARLTRTERP